MTNPWVLLVFLSIFHVIGAAVLAVALRDLWHARRRGIAKGLRSALLAIWGMAFGCLPFGFGVSLADGGVGTSLVLLGEICAWMSSFLITLLAGQTLRARLEPFFHQDTLLMLFGGGFLVAGAAVMNLVTGWESPVGFLVGGVSALVGGAIFAYGLWRLLRSTR